MALLERSEHIEQREFVSWFRKTFSGVLIFAIPNGGGRSPADAMRLKVEGVTPGIPDLFIPEWRVWVEMKKKNGKPSPQQVKVIKYLEEKNYTCLICYGFDDARMKILKIKESIACT